MEHDGLVATVDQKGVVTPLRKECPRDRKRKCLSSRFSNTTSMQLIKCILLYRRNCIYLFFCFS